MASDYFSRSISCPCWTCIGLTRGEESDEKRFVPAGVVDKIVFSRNYSADQRFFQDRHSNSLRGNCSMINRQASAVSSARQPMLYTLLSVV